MQLQDYCFTWDILLNPLSGIFQSISKLNPDKKIGLKYSR